MKSEQVKPPMPPMPPMQNEIEIIKLDDSTYRIEDGFVYCYLLEGKTDALLIDSGVSDPDIAEKVEELTCLPITLVNTHGDGDHITGNASFPEYYIHPEELVHGKVLEKFPNLPHHDLHEGDVFDLGERSVRVIEIPGHTYGSVALLDEKNRVLYAGDTVQDGEIFLFGDHRCPEKFASALERIVAMKGEFDLIRSAHGTPDLPADYAERVLEDWTQFLTNAKTGIVETFFDGTEITRCEGEWCTVLR